MNRIKHYFVSAVIALCALIPPIDFRLAPPPEWYPYLFLIAGALGIGLWFINTSNFIRVAATICFVNCFFSVAPYLSFATYIAIVMACYFYTLCFSVENNLPILKTLQVIWFMNLILLVIQMMGRDSLLNFGLHHNECIGTVGQYMQAGSFSIILTAALLRYNRLNFILPFLVAIYGHSAWTFLAVSVGLLVYLFFTHKRAFKIVGVWCAIAFIVMGLFFGKFESNIGQHNGRLIVWKKSLEIASHRPLTGWGVGTYKLVFPPISNLQTRPWMSAHNFWVQAAFEMGFVIAAALVIWPMYIFMRVWLNLRHRLVKEQAIILMAALSMVLVDMLVHFPDRMLQALPIMIFFMAYVMKFIRKGDHLYARA